MQSATLLTCGYNTHQRIKHNHCIMMPCSQCSSSSSAVTGAMLCEGQAASCLTVSNTVTGSLQIRFKDATALKPLPLTVKLSAPLMTDSRLLT